jgi:DNA-binding response OmpR family regulator
MVNFVVFPVSHEGQRSGSRAPIPPVSTSTQRSNNLNSKRILLLERDLIQASAIEHIILQTGHLVVGPAHNLEEALKRVEAGEIDLALLEWELGDGTDPTPIAEMLTGQDKPYAFLIEPGDIVDPLAFPDAHYLRKPLSAQSLDALLEKLLPKEIEDGELVASASEKELVDVVLFAKSGHTAELESRILGHGRIPTKMDEAEGHVRYLLKEASEEEIEHLRTGLDVGVSDVDP